MLILLQAIGQVRYRGQPPCPARRALIPETQLAKIPECCRSRSLTQFCWETRNCPSMIFVRVSHSQASSTMVVRALAFPALLIP